MGGGQGDQRSRRPLKRGLIKLSLTLNKFSPKREEARSARSRQNRLASKYGVCQGDLVQALLSGSRASRELALNAEKCPCWLPTSRPSFHFSRDLLISSQGISPNASMSRPSIATQRVSSQPSLPTQPDQYEQRTQPPLSDSCRTSIALVGYKALHGMSAAPSCSD